MAAQHSTPTSSGQERNCPASYSGDREKHAAVPRGCYSLVVVLRWWSRTYNKNLHLRLYKTSSGRDVSISLFEEERKAES
ncbi:unnamed protein product [Pleuronectes platessa]|uniref:Uncharacterized protein n=1 Tax=Pleuronectes platessa TaxID=8262 RepID=A0A9N7UTS2_PLEPL|nr:unnamed protein product [Pleuronectes platessa]